MESIFDRLIAEKDAPKGKAGSPPTSGSIFDSLIAEKEKATATFDNPLNVAVGAGAEFVDLSKDLVQGIAGGLNEIINLPGNILRGTPEKIGTPFRETMEAFPIPWEAVLPEGALETKRALGYPWKVPGILGPPAGEAILEGTGSPEMAAGVESAIEGLLPIILGADILRRGGAPKPPKPGVEPAPPKAPPPESPPVPETPTPAAEVSLSDITAATEAKYAKTYKSEAAARRKAQTLTEEGTPTEVQPTEGGFKLAKKPEAPLPPAEVVPEPPARQGTAPETATAEKPTVTLEEPPKSLLDDVIQATEAKTIFDDLIKDAKKPPAETPPPAEPIPAPKVKVEPAKIGKEPGFVVMDEVGKIVSFHATKESAEERANKLSVEPPAVAKEDESRGRPAPPKGETATVPAPPLPAESPPPIERRSEERPQRSSYSEDTVPDLPTVQGDMESVQTSLTRMEEEYAKSRESKPNSMDTIGLAERIRDYKESLSRLKKREQGLRAPVPAEIAKETTKTETKEVVMRPWPTSVQRIEEKGAPRATFDRPHGVYTTPAGVKSPHEDLGGEKYELELDPKAKTVDIPTFPRNEITMRKDAPGAGSGVHAARHFLGEKQFKVLRQMTKERLKEWATDRFKEFPYEFGRYFDRQEIMEAIGGLLSKEKGYDAFRVLDADGDPSWDEVVLLTERAIKKTLEPASPKVPLPPKKVSNKPHPHSILGSWKGRLQVSKEEWRDQKMDFKEGTGLGRYFTQRPALKWDVKVGELMERGILPAGSNLDTLIERLQSERKARAEGRPIGPPTDDQVEAAGGEFLRKQEEKYDLQPVRVEALETGDKFWIQDDDFVVVEEHEDGGVTIVDGETVRIPPNEVLYINKGMAGIETPQGPKYKESEPSTPAERLKKSIEDLIDEKMAKAGVARAETPTLPGIKPGFKLAAEEAPAAEKAPPKATGDQPLLTGTEKAYRDVGMGDEEPKKKPPPDDTTLYGGFPLFDPTVWRKAYPNGLDDIIKETIERRKLAKASIRDDLHWFNNVVNTPYYVFIDKHPEGKPVFDRARRAFQEREDITSDLSEMLAPYARLSQKEQKPINKALIRGRYRRKVYTDAELRSSQHLNDTQIEAYKAVRKAMDHALSLFEDAVVYRLTDGQVQNSSDLSPDMLADVLDQLYESDEEGPSERMTNRKIEFILETVDKFRKKKRGGYIPFSRFGDHAFGIKQASDGKYVYWSTAETGWKAGGEFQKVKKRFAKSLQDGKYVAVPPREMAKHAKRDLINGVGAFEVGIILEMAGVDTASNAAFKELIDKLIQEQGFKSHFIESSDLPGFSTDIERALADYVVGISGYIARMKAVPEMDKVALPAFKAKPKLAKYYEEWKKYIFSPQEEFHRLRSAMFVYYLGGNIKSALVNLTQPFVVTGPWLTQYVSETRAAKELARAYADVTKALGEKEGGGWGIEVNKLPSDVREQIRRAIHEGIISETLLHELMATARKPPVLRKMSKHKQRVSYYMGMLFSRAEKANRMVAMIAALRIHDAVRQRRTQPGAAGAGGGGMAPPPPGGGPPIDDDPFEFAKRAVDETQFIYGKLNRPRMFRSWGALLGVFRTFALMFIEGMARIWRVSRRAVLNQMAMLWAFAGVLGLPLAQDAKNIVEGIFEILTHKVPDPETAMKEWGKETLGSVKAVDILLHGPFRNVFGADLSRSIGQGDVVPGLGSTGNWLADVVGVPADIPLRVQKAYNAAMEGNYGRSAEAVAPEFIRNPMVAGRWAKEGVLNPAGQPILAKDKLTALDIFYKTIGVQPTKVSIAYEREEARDRLRKRLDRAERDLTRQIVERFRQKDSKGAIKLIYTADGIQTGQTTADGGPEIIPVLHGKIKKPEDMVIISLPNIIRMQKEQMLGDKMTGILKQPYLNRPAFLKLNDLYQ